MSNVTITSKYPCPRVDLPSGERVEFANYTAVVSAKVAKEIREHAADLVDLGLEQGAATTRPSGDTPVEVEVPHDPAGVPPIDPPDYDKLSYAELKVINAERNLGLPGNASRDAIIEAAKAADAATAHEAELINDPATTGPSLVEGGPADLSEADVLQG